MAAAVLVGLASCGGGGGGAGAGSMAGTGALEGTVLVPGIDGGIVAEREPNGSPTQAQVLPPLQPRSVVVVAGEAGAAPDRYGDVDATDAFRMVGHVEQDVTLTLSASTDGGARGDFDLAVVRTATGTPLGASATSSDPEVVAFRLAADDPVDVVVTCASGAGAYALRVETQDVAPLRAGAVASPAPAPSLDAVGYLLAEPDCAPGRLLVRAEGGPAAAARLAALVGGTVRGRTTSGTWIVGFAPRFLDTGAREAAARAARLATERGVAFAEPDWTVRVLATPDDPDLGRQWNLFAVGAPAAWDVTWGDPTVVVGVADTGIAPHPDHDAQVVGGYDFVGDDGGRGPDPTDPGDGAGYGGASTWHGTHVAGIVAARANDGHGVCGLAPGCRVMPLRVVGRGGGTASDLADAIRYAAGLAATADGPPLEHPLRVVNVSLGTPQDASELRQAVEEAVAAGVLLVAAVGNDGGPVLYPAAYPGVLGVSAVDGRLVWAGYGNRGAQVALVAPGGAEERDAAGDGFPDAVLSTVLDETVAPAAPAEGYLSGTSMAAPHVAAAAALLFSLDPSLTAAQASDVLTSTCRDVDTPGFDVRTGAGLLQVGEALRRVLADRGQPRSDPPRLLLSSTTLRLRDAETSAAVLVVNGGGGTLHVGSVTASTDSGVPWLSATVRPNAPGAASDAAAIVVAVDRSTLSPGVYAGSVLVSDGTRALGSLRVVTEVGPFPLTAAWFLVVAEDAVTGVRRASTIAGPQDGYRYLFASLPAGRYRIRAGSDLDGDGVICEEGDWCGVYGGTSPGEVQVQAGGRTTAVDVVLAR